MHWSGAWPQRELERGSCSCEQAGSWREPECRSSIWSDQVVARSVKLAVTAAGLVVECSSGCQHYSAGTSGHWGHVYVNLS